MGASLSCFCHIITAQPFVPGLALKVHAFPLAEMLFPLLDDWWACFPPRIPSAWKDGWLHWLPKPNKNPSRPESLRPLAIQEPIGKCLADKMANLGFSGWTKHTRCHSTCHCSLPMCSAEIVGTETIGSSKGTPRNPPSGEWWHPSFS